MPSYTYKISELPSASSLTSSNILPIVDTTSMITKKLTAQQLLNYVTGSTFNTLTVNLLTGSTITGSLARFQNITGSTVTGSTALFTTISGSNLSGTTAQFTILTGSTVTGSTALFDNITASLALFTGDIRVLGTASITQLNTLNQTSLLVGDKYITILSGGIDHTGINGAGFLWGTSSGPGETTGSLGEHAHILYDASRDALEIFPGLYVSGNTVLDGDLSVNSNTGSLNLRKAAAANTIEMHIRPEAGKKGYITFTENTVADRWVVGIENGVDSLLFKAGSAVANTERMRITSDGRVGIGTNSPQVSSKLHVSGGSSDVKLRIDSTGADPLLTWTTIAQQDWSAGIDFSDSGKFKIQNSLTAGTLTRLTIDTVGNVGIGTNSPVTKLHVSGIGEILRLETSAVSGNNYVLWTDPSRFKGYVGYGSTGADDQLSLVNYSGTLTFGTNNTIRATINTSGNLGIGTSNPLARLQSTTDVVPGGSTPVVASMSSSSLYLNNWDDLYGMMFGVSGSGTGWIQQQRRDSNVQYPLLLNPLGGNVGIGTNNPATKLDVNGSIRVTGGSIYGQVAEITASVSTTYTLQSSDSGKFLTISNGSPVTLTVPSGLPTGFTVSICQLGAGQITVSPSGVTINNRQSHTKTAGQYAIVSLIGTVANTYIFGGDTSA
jgi:hypothetical protein